MPTIPGARSTCETSASEPRLVAERLTYATADGRSLFQDLTLSFCRERTGLIGANGSGKTTLVRLLVGELSPSHGTVHRTGVIAVLPQDFRPAPDQPLSVILGIEERLAALDRLDAGEGSPADVELVGDDWELPARTAAEMARFGLTHLPLDRPVGTVSGGEATRLALAGLALGRPDFLILDEPTNHLDAGSREALYNFVEHWTGGMLAVSHDRALLGHMDRIVELSALGVRVYRGDYGAYRARRDADDAAAEREMDSARAELRRAERRSRELRERQARREASGRRDRKTANIPRIMLGTYAGRAQGTAARVRAVTEREMEERRERVAVARQRVEERELPRFDLPSSGLAAGRTVLEMSGVSLRFPGAAAPVLHDISLSMVGPERVAVVGPNASGKTTLLRVALGRREPDVGVVRRLPDTEVVLLDQHGAALDSTRSVLANFREYHPDMEESAVRHTLARFLFSHEAALRIVGTLSGGERLRVSLACVLGGARTPSMLVLDEPTNHLDLEALTALEGALRSYDGALLVVSHDAAFLEAIVVERRLVLG